MNQNLGYQYLSQIQSPVEIKGSISVNSSSDSGIVPIGVWEGGVMGALIVVIIVGGIWWWKSRQKSNTTVVLSEVLKNLKKEIRAAQNPKECQEDQKLDRLAQGSMFSFGTVTVTLQTIVDQKGELRLIAIPKNESGLSAQIRQENTQSLTLQLNPLKVVDGEKSRRVIVNFSSQNSQSKTPKEWSIPPEIAAPWQVHLLLVGAALCSNARLIHLTGPSRWQEIGDPTEAALLVAAIKAGLKLEQLQQQCPRRREVPFDG